MLNIQAVELDDLRARLLAAVLTGSIDGDLAAQALITAKDLDGLSLLIQESGDSGIYSDTREFGHLLQEVLDDQSAANK